MAVTRRKSRLSGADADVSMGEASASSSKNALATATSGKMETPRKRPRKSQPPEDGTIHGSEGSNLGDIGIKTSEDLIRTLKSRASVKNEKLDGLDSITIASIAWRDQHVQIPRKGDLLLSWILDELAREAKSLERGQTGKGKQSSQDACIDVRYWQLAENITTATNRDELQRSAAKQPLESILFAFGQLMQLHTQSDSAKGAAKIALLASASNCLGMLFSSQAGAQSGNSLDMALSGLSAWLQVAREVIVPLDPTLPAGVDAELLGSLSNLLQIAVKLWLRYLGRPAVVQKSRIVFLESMLDPFAQLIFWLGKAALVNETNGANSTTSIRIALVRSTLLRISFECLYASDKSIKESSEALVAKLTSKTDDKWVVIPTLIEQRCLALKTHISQRGVTLQQQAEARRQAVVDTVSPLLSLLVSREDSLEERTDRLDSLRKGLQAAEDHNLDLATLARTSDDCFQAAKQYIMRSFTGTSSQKEAEVKAALRSVSVLHSMDQNALSPREWAAVGRTILQQQEMPEAISLLRSVGDAAARKRSLDVMVSWLFDATHPSPTSPRKDDASHSILFDFNLWEKHLGVNLKTFVSEQQVVRILETVRTEVSRTDAVSTLVLASQIISHISIPKPAEAQAVELLQRIQDDIQRRFVQPVLQTSGDSTRPALSAAAIGLIQAITSRAMSLRGAAQTLLLQIDDAQDQSFIAIKDKLVDRGRPASQVNTTTIEPTLYLQVLDRVSRDDQAGRRSRFFDIIKDDHALAIALKEGGASYIQLVSNSYLDVLDRHASKQVLELFASIVIQGIVSSQEPATHSALEAILSNARNLELANWQRALSEALQSQSPEKTINLLAALADVSELALSSAASSRILQHGSGAVTQRIVESRKRKSVSEDSKVEFALQFLTRQIRASTLNLKLHDVIAPHQSYLLDAAANATNLAIVAFLQAIIQNVSNSDAKVAATVAQEMLRHASSLPSTNGILALRTTLHRYNVFENDKVVHMEVTRSEEDIVASLESLDAQAVPAQELVDKVVQRLVEQGRLIDSRPNDGTTRTPAFCVGIMKCLERAASLDTRESFDILDLASQQTIEMMAVFDIHPHHLAVSLAQISTKASLDEYTRVLEKMRASTEDYAGNFKHWRARLQVLCLLLCNGPEGSLSASQVVLLHLFASFPAILSNAADAQAAASTIADAIESIVTGRMLLFKQREVGACLAVVTALLAPRPSLSICSGTNASSIFTSLTTSLTHLIRLRADAVSPLLPQVTVVLANLVGLFREPIKAVAHSASQKSEHAAYSALLPPWLNVQSAPLDVTQARQLSRLFSAVTARSSTKASLMSSERDDRHKRTLAKPFGSHAVYVLLAYIRNLTKLDEIYAVPARKEHASDDVVPRRALVETVFARGDTGEELARAMYSVCDVVSTHQRNLLMDFLADDGERVVARRLFRAHEAQRYKG